MPLPEIIYYFCLVSRFENQLDANILRTNRFLYYDSSNEPIGNRNKCEKNITSTTLYVYFSWKIRVYEWLEQVRYGLEIKRFSNVAGDSFGALWNYRNTTFLFKKNNTLLLFSWHNDIPHWINRFFYLII